MHTCKKYLGRGLHNIHSCKQSMEMDHLYTHVSSVWEGFFHTHSCKGRALPYLLSTSGSSHFNLKNRRPGVNNFECIDKSTMIYLSFALLTVWC